MSKLIPGNQKHLTLQDRLFIEESLDAGVSFKDIEKYLCKDPTTISKEIRAHRLSVWRDHGLFVNMKNFCVRRYSCRKTNACGKLILCGVRCASCPTCNLRCPDFEREKCRRLDCAPYVCNGCPKRNTPSKCHIAQKYRYDARFSERKYKELLSDARAGIHCTRKELHEIDKVISPLISQGQSPYQILTNHPEIDLSVRTLYQYINDGHFCARNIDLKRKTKFKPRKCHKTQITNRDVFIGRTYTCFQALGLEKWVEMDTVKSSRESRKCLLTFYFTREKLFLAYLMNRCTPGAVRLIFDQLEKRIGAYEFNRLFGTILTDRGVEFGKPQALETGIDGIERTSIYFCDPLRSGQKGGVENAHTMLRMVLPKGTSVGFLTQWDVHTIVNHINSTPRESLDGQTPYDLSLATYGSDVIKKLQLKRIEPDRVQLTPKLIRNN
jgi:IS30 family transposase